MCKEKNKESQNRVKILNFISKHPGLHLKKISNELNIPKSTLSYHLKILEKKDLIRKKYNNYCTRFYPSKILGYQEKKILTLIRQPTLQKIIYHLCYNIVSSETELAKDLEKNLSTINYHLQKLFEAEIIEYAPYNDGIINTKKGGKLFRKRISNEKFYRLKSPTELKDFLIKYQKMFKNDLMAELIIYLTKYRRETGFNFDKINTKGERVDDVLEIFYDVFPHPYYV
jgi:DNA-binding transcriptional ArsR family regulator